MVIDSGERCFYHRLAGFVAHDSDLTLGCFELGRQCGYETCIKSGIGRGGFELGDETLVGGLFGAGDGLVGANCCR